MTGLLLTAALVCGQGCADDAGLVRKTRIVLYADTEGRDR